MANLLLTDFTIDKHTHCIDFSFKSTFLTIFCWWHMQMLKGENCWKYQPWVKVKNKQHTAHWVLFRRGKETFIEFSFLGTSHKLCLILKTLQKKDFIITNLQMKMIKPQRYYITCPGHISIKQHSTKLYFQKLGSEYDPYKTMFQSIGFEVRWVWVWLSLWDPPNWPGQIILTSLKSFTFLTYKIWVTLTCPSESMIKIGKCL